MKLTLMNGYPSPYPVALTIDDADSFAEAAGGITLTIEGVRHFEWKHTVTIEFEDFESFEKARDQTGWKRWGHRPDSGSRDQSEGGLRPPRHRGRRAVRQPPQDGVLRLHAAGALT